MIWMFSFGGPRVFRLTPCTHQLTTWATMMVDHKPPSSGAACRESRHLFQRCGKFLFGAEGLAIKSLWFRPSEDILYLDHMLIEHLQHESYYSGCDFTTIENVAINWRGKHDESNLQRLADALVEFPSCKRMLLVMSHGEPPYGGDVEFLHVSDDDPRKVCFWKEERFDWAGLKQALEEHWRNDTRQSSEQDSGESSGESSRESSHGGPTLPLRIPLPSMEAVEVVPRRTPSTPA